MDKKIIKGFEAIEAARFFAVEIALNKYADPTEGAKGSLTVEEAEEVAREDAGLIWCEITDGETDQISQSKGGKVSWAVVGYGGEVMEVFDGPCNPDSAAEYYANEGDFGDGSPIGVLLVRQWDGLERRVAETDLDGSV